MTAEFPKTYNTHALEADIYDYWQKQRCFTACYARAGGLADKPLNAAAAAGRSGAEPEPYCMVIPPPNVTGRLHMGHALNGTLQDMIIRYQRMCGRDALWLPGTDHAGIATQTVVKKMLDERGIDYRNLGAEKFIEHVFAWKEKYGGHILEQFRHLGASCDWSRTRFTMDPEMAHAVMVAFTRLYNDGLIYKGNRIVNWCPVDQTALADDEVEHAANGEPGELHEICYPFAAGAGDDGMRGLIVATVRPETLFGDVAVAVHPEDTRYQKYIGKHLRLPFMERILPIIADAHVERSFGTGCLKVTSGHAKDDFAIAMRHGLPIVTVMDERAMMNAEVPEAFRGLTREACRTKVVAELKAQGLLVRSIPYNVRVGRSYRSKAIVEHRVSEQWFVKMKPLAERLLAAPDRIHFYPQRVEKQYHYWLENIEDWCISRQIWWGHRIPAWVHAQTGAIRVGVTAEAALNGINIAERTAWAQESDVLDTWFSSALWPLSTLGWPDEQAPDFKRYFPTATLSTAKDILFFWVARMALMSHYFTGKQPFKHVYIHPTILDSKGQTMSKSKGNGIDPNHIINGATVEEMKEPVLAARPGNAAVLLREIEAQYAEGFPGVGADALRYTLLYLLTSSQAVQLGMKDFLTLGRRFTTKFWNAARMVFLNIAAVDEHLTRAVGTDGMKWAAGFNGTNGISGLATEPMPADIAAQARWMENFLGPWSQWPLAEQWMELECYRTFRQLEQAYAQFDFSSMGAMVYQLVWTNFCDHYLELIKPCFRFSKAETEQGAETTASETRVVLSRLVFLVRLFMRLLLLLHPLLPFMSEYIWRELHAQLRARGFPFALAAADHHPLMETPFLRTADFQLALTGLNLSPTADVAEHELLQLFTVFKRMLSKLHALRKRYGVGARLLLRASADVPAGTPMAPSLTRAFAKQRQLLREWMYVEILSELPAQVLRQAVTIRDEAFTLQMDLAEHVDWGREAARLGNDERKWSAQLTHIEKRLANASFMAKARKELIAAEQAKTEQLRQELAAITAELKTVAARVH